MTSYAKIVIEDDRVYAPEFDDIYFNPKDGRAESIYVFLEGNHLPARWQGKADFCIAETGFGTGLNFLLTLDAWFKDSRHSRSLHYVSIEARPLHPDQLAIIHSRWPELQEHSRELITQYPRILHGSHTLLFAGGRVQLQLIFEDVSRALTRYRLRPDCWYLDGFAPSRNPSMWQAPVLQEIARNSLPGTSLATFTAAGEVRRNLLEVGFEVSKRKGFGRKREMLCAIRGESQQDSRPNTDQAWFSLATSARPSGEIAIIGAGIAGAQTAWHLAQQGIRVTVFEAEREYARGASGNPAGVLAPRLTASPSSGERFYLSAFYYQLRQLSVLQQQGHEVAFTDCGLLQIAHNAAGEKRIRQLALREDLPDSVELLEPQQVSTMLGEEVSVPGVLIRDAGAISPRSLVKALLHHPNIKLHPSTPIVALDTRNARPVLCLAGGENREFEAVVLANGERVADFCKTAPLIPVRGQTSSARAPKGRAVEYAVDHAGYLVPDPGIPQSLVFGATYLREDTNSELRDADTRYNIQTLGEGLPELKRKLTEIQSCHAGIRATTPDRWPLVGAPPNTDFYLREYADLHTGKQYKSYPGAQYITGVYMLTGLGSRGLASAAYCANLLTHIMLGQTLPATLDEYHALHPARFLVRDLKKGRVEKV